MGEKAHTKNKTMVLQKWLPSVKAGTTWVSKVEIIVLETGCSTILELQSSLLLTNSIVMQNLFVIMQLVITTTCTGKCSLHTAGTLTRPRTSYQRWLQQ